MGMLAENEAAFGAVGLGDCVLTHCDGPVRYNWGTGTKGRNRKV